MTGARKSRPRRQHLTDAAKAKQLAWLVELFRSGKSVRAARAKTMSGGEQHMLAIGRPLMMQPKI